MKKTKKFGIGGAMPAPVGKNLMRPPPAPMGMPSPRIMDAINGRGDVPNREIRRAVRQDNNILRRGQGQPVVKQTPNSGGILTKGSAPGTFVEAPDLVTPLPPNPNPPGRYDVNPPTSGAGGVMPKPMGGGLSSEKFGAPSMGAGPLPSPVAPPPAGGMMPQTGGMKKGGKVQVKSKASSASKVRGHGCETRGKTKGQFV